MRKWQADLFILFHDEGVDKENYNSPYAFCLYWYAYILRDAVFKKSGQKTPENYAYSSGWTWCPQEFMPATIVGNDKEGCIYLNVCLPITLYQVVNLLHQCFQIDEIDRQQASRGESIESRLFKARDLLNTAIRMCPLRPRCWGRKQEVHQLYIQLRDGLNGVLPTQQKPSSHRGCSCFG